MPPRPWCRLYHSTHRSPDLRDQPYGVRLAWYVALELATIAGRSGALGLRFPDATPEQRFAKLAHLRCNVAQEALGYFVSCRMMRRTSTDYIIIGWDAYQRKSDTSNERVTGYREQVTRDSNVTVSPSRAGAEQSRAEVEQMREEQSRPDDDCGSIEPVDNPALEIVTDHFTRKAARVPTDAESATFARLTRRYGPDAVTVAIGSLAERGDVGNMKLLSYIVKDGAP
jgi:hypothetical protein